MTEILIIHVKKSAETNAKLVYINSPKEISTVLTFPNFHQNNCPKLCTAKTLFPATKQF